MEEGSVDTLQSSSLAREQGDVDVRAASSDGLGRDALDTVARLHVLGGNHRRLLLGAAGIAEGSNTIDRLPLGERVDGRGAGEAEAGSGERASCPGVVDVGQVPLDRFGGGMSVELVPGIDESLDRRHVDMVDGGTIQDDGMEGRSCFSGVNVFASSWAGVVPRAIL